jgi:DNA-binding MarR family transcriptional regulator
MSFEATYWASRARGIEPSQKLILFYLADYHTADFGCEIEVPLLSEQTEISVSDVVAHLAELQRAGWVILDEDGRIWLNFEPGFPVLEGHGVPS